MFVIEIKKIGVYKIIANQHVVAYQKMLLVYKCRIK